MKYNWKDTISYLFGNKDVGTNSNVNIAETMLHFEPKKEPVIGELAQQLADAIRAGKLRLGFKPIGDLEFCVSGSGIQCNNLFNVDEQALLYQAHKEWKAKLAQEELNKSAQQLKNLLSSLDK